MPWSETVLNASFLSVLCACVGVSRCLCRQASYQSTMTDSQDDHNSSSNGNNFGGPLFYVNHGMFQPGTGMPPPQHPFMHAATHPLALHPYMTFAAQFPHFHFPHPHLLQQAQMSGQALQHMAQFPHGLQPPPLASPSEGHVEAFQQSSPRSGPRVPKSSNGSTPSPSSSVSHSGPTSLDPKESETATALLELFKNPVTDDAVKSRKRPAPQRKVGGLLSRVKRDDGPICR